MKRTVLVVDDEANMQAVMRMILEGAGHVVVTASSAEEALPHLADPEVDVLLTDLRMPGMGGEALVQRARQERPDVPIVIVTAHGTISSAVRAIRDGAADYLTKPFEPEQLEILVHNAIKLRDILRENRELRETIGRRRSGRRMVGGSPASVRMLEEIRRVAPYRTNVLIRGESGTGKELVARTLHDLSPRAAGPWVALNCSAIPHDLMETELFGHARGAFTGAVQRRAGRLEQAEGGTLFLDEIGDLDLALQAKLLRVIQEREFSSVGSDAVRRVDVRFIAATHRDLAAMVAQGRFREDLLYRLDVYRIEVPPLCERREDLGPLAESFLREFAQETGRPLARITPEALDAMERYRWPGNIRELRNAMERAFLVAREETIRPEDLPGTIAMPHRLPAADKPLPAAAAPGPERALDAWLSDLERHAIEEALAESEGVQAQAARRLGITERSLWHRVKKFGIRIERVVRR